MKLKETKIIAILTLLGLAVLSLPNLGSATDYASTNFTVKDPVIDTGSSSSTSTNFGLGQSTSQTAIGKSTSTNFQLWSGFQYYYKINANTLTATAGNGKVDLSWTAPATFLGISVSSYEVGTGTTSGSYTFADIGSDTSYSKTGLTNSTQYYFKIKAKSTGGRFLVFSNEATATPTGGGGGGGGGGYSPPPPSTGTGSVVLRGLASPSASVTVLKDGSLVATATADPGAIFNITASGLGTGIYSFAVYADDVKGLRSSTTSFVVSVTNGVTTVIDNIFLGPSIATDKSVVKQGDTLNIFGYTVPSSNVTVFVNSSQQFLNKVTAASSGAWSQAFNTIVLDQGAHTTKSQSAKENLLSVYSNTLAFQVGNESVTTPASLKDDLNKDSRVNLVDLSILLYWFNRTGFPGYVDLNEDGRVDLVDFSILLYHWTG